MNVMKSWIWPCCIPDNLHDSKQASSRLLGAAHILFWFPQLQNITKLQLKPWYDATSILYLGELQSQLDAASMTIWSIMSVIMNVEDELSTRRGWEPQKNSWSESLLSSALLIQQPFFFDRRPFINLFFKNKNYWKQSLQPDIRKHTKDGRLRKIKIKKNAK